MADEPLSRREDFPPTRWTLIQRAGDADSTQKQAALEEFCRTYWFPLYGYARRRGKSIHDAQDAVQGFFARLLRDPQFFEQLDSERGKLRSWLLTSLRYHMANEWDHAQATKRGGGAEILAIDIGIAEERLGEALELAGPDAEREFDRRWAETVLSVARRNLRTAHQAAGKEREFAALEPFLTEGTPPNLIETVAGRLEKSKEAVTMAISRLRNGYRQEIRKEIAETMGFDADVDREFEYLIACLSIQQ